MKISVRAIDHIPNVSRRFRWASDVNSSDLMRTVASRIGKCTVIPAKSQLFCGWPPEKHSNAYSFRWSLKLFVGLKNLNGHGNFARHSERSRAPFCLMNNSLHEVCCSPLHAGIYVRPAQPVITLEWSTYISCFKTNSYDFTFENHLLRTTLRKEPWTAACVIQTCDPNIERVIQTLNVVDTFT